MPDLICIVCPRGCRIHVDDSLNVTGNFCKRGETYSRNEVTHPMRMITSTVKIQSEILVRLPVMTDRPIPKNQIFKVMEAINQVEVQAPIKIRDVVIKNVLGLGVDIVATRNVEK
jgi:CxxC motif-containing protein